MSHRRRQAPSQDQPGRRRYHFSTPCLNFPRRRVEREQNEEAEEQHSIELDVDASNVTDDDGEDMMEDIDRDYKRIPELDQYEHDGIDE